jgi:hypothetical protein
MYTFHLRDGLVLCTFSRSRLIGLCWYYHLICCCQTSCKNRAHLDSALFLVAKLLAKSEHKFIALVEIYWNLNKILDIPEEVESQLQVVSQQCFVTLKKLLSHP